MLAALTVALRAKMPRVNIPLLALLGASGQALPIWATLASIKDSTGRGNDWGNFPLFVHQTTLLLEYGITGLCLATAIYFVARSRA